MNNYVINEKVLRKQKILIIEDENDLLEEISLMLKFENYSVVKAKNGVEGIILTKTSIPDLILCDIVMKDLNGFEVLKQLKENSATAGIPFIFLTALSDQNSIRKSIELGADDYLIKPFSRVYLLDTIKAQLLKYEEIQNQISQLKSDISYCISKEIKPQLYKIITNSKVMKSFSDVMSENDILETGTSIYEKSIKLEEIINKLIILVELDTCKKRFKTSKRNLTAEKIAEFAGKIAEKYSRKHDLIVSVNDITITASGKWFFIALNELINNAFRESDYGENIVIKAGREDDYTELLIYVVSTEMTCYVSEIKSGLVKLTRASCASTGDTLSMILVLKIISLLRGEVYITSDQNRTVPALIKLPV